MNPSQDGTNDPTAAEVQKIYREVTIFLRDKYFPHYNLYQRTMLQGKAKCFSLSNQEPDNYFSCVEKLEETMKENSQILKQKFDGAEAKDSECQNKCRKSGAGNKGQGQYLQCINKCATTLKDNCVKISNEFYDQVLANDPEYKKLRNS